MAVTSQLNVVRVIVLITLVFSWGPEKPTPGAEPDPPAHGWAEIQREWKARQNGVESLVVEWTQERTDLKGSLSSAVRFLKVDAFGDGDVPPEDTTYVNNCRLVLDGTRSRYEYQGHAWSATAGALTERDYICAFDGTVAAESYPVPRLQRFPTGTLRADDGNFQLTLVDCRPLMWHIRPLDPEMGGFPANEMVVDSDADLIGDTLCVVASTDRPGNRHWKYWLDPADTYRLVRATRRVNRFLDLQVDVSYSRTPSGHSYPSHWTTEVWRDGRRTRADATSVQEINLNPEVGNDGIAVRFTPGTRVVDLRSGIQNVLWVDDTGALHSPARTRPHDRVRWILYANVALAIALAAGAFRRWRRHKQRTNPPSPSQQSQG